MRKYYAQRGARTHDPEIKSLMLYRLRQSWGTLAHHEGGRKEKGGKKKREEKREKKGKRIGRRDPSGPAPSRLKAGAHLHTMRGEERKKGGRRKERKKGEKKGKRGGKTT